MSSKLHVFCFSKKEIKTYEVGFTFSEAMGFVHVENYLYIGGGTFDYSEFFSQFRKLKSNGECTGLQEITNPKLAFPMTHWRQKSSLFTLGGYNGSYLK